MVALRVDSKAAPGNAWTHLFEEEWVRIHLHPSSSEDEIEHRKLQTDVDKQEVSAGPTCLSTRASSRRIGPTTVSTLELHPTAWSVQGHMRHMGSVSNSSFDAHRQFFRGQRMVGLLRVPRAQGL